MAMPHLPPRVVPIELSHEEYMRLSALARNEGKSRNAILRAWLRPFLDKLPPAEFDSERAARSILSHSPGVR